MHFEEMKIIRFFNHSSRVSILLIGIWLIIIIGSIDYVTGNSLSFSIFYLIPIALIAWFVNRNFGLMLAILSSITWFLVGSLHEIPESMPIAIWNSFIRLGFFSIITIMLARLKISYEQERHLSRIDPLTTALNRRAFYSHFQTEMDYQASSHSPLTFCYFDLDNFKYVNDTLGHAIGDEILKRTVLKIKSILGPTDTIARFGGDEFGILFPRLATEKASVIMEGIRKALLLEMQANDWPITFSIGVGTFTPPFPPIEEMVKIADQLMYKAKNEGKNQIQYR